MTSVGLVGHGRWGKYILRDLLALGVDVHVAAPSVASRDAALAAGAASAHDRAEHLPDADGYVVAVPTVLHAAIVETLIARDRPIFVEKPLTHDVAAARSIASRAPHRVFVMDKWRYHPGIEALAACARSGELGEILAIRTYRLGWDNPHRDVDAVWILAPHDLSIAYEILGFLPPARSAFALPAGQPQAGLVGVLADDRGGPLVVIEISAHHPQSRRAVVVIGTKGSAQLADSYDDRIIIAKGAPGVDAGRPEEILVGNAMPLARELAAFVGHLRGGPPPRSSAGEGLLVVDRIAALRRLAGMDAA